MKNQLNKRQNPSSSETPDSQQTEQNLPQSTTRPGDQVKPSEFETTACGLRVVDDEEGEEREF